MYDVLLIALIIVSILLIISVLLQPSKTNAASALSGGAEQLFGKQKARGFEAGLRRVTAVLGFLFIGLAIALAYLSSN
ncbi:preprotein translocase subunit SecG [Jeotgalibaca sp. PTS2502]|uniref:Protein-export membrane protein SecG n=2 Tax=Jeotgalibaca TaxID=1470540 RepID=A0A6G7K748_9LACT|nr:MULTISPECIES: preprotein translocase subunit SecG [Jeotgalibaca]APZ48563.1 preprotein translocase subunit SecG [Jeotgalibaca sp. PTS2502]QII81080.1 preprotein translocase subunit SecG [Jeotgalibaca arthritidis]HJA90189.1 preprotein translocase subunit SecG [Candidatus Jeotgalibaca merdavium]